MKRSVAVSIVCLCGMVSSPAQDAGAPSSPPEMQALRAEMEPTLDGDVLGDPAWASIPPARGFWQTAPFEGQPASETTEVRIVYTPQTLYVGVVCFDRAPSEIIISETQRDSVLDETDSFQIIFDTYRDHQNGFVFATTPTGLEYDGQVSREGEGSGSGPGSGPPGGGRQQRGSGGGFNKNWDGAWEVRTKVFEEGWSAEFAIPFRTLRYPAIRQQTWGVNFQRTIPRRREKAFWSPLPRQFSLYRVSLAGSLSGLELQPQRNLKLMPYVLGKMQENTRSKHRNWLGDGGFDVKYSLTPSLTLDGTYNTDFAQVEVDEEQINLDRFDLFFPEKRPFFLENAGLFAVGDPGELELFFSRRIGIGKGGVAIPIQGGARLTGKVGQTNIGFLNMQTEEIEGIAPGNNFTVARLNHELPNRSSLGFLVTNRHGFGSIGDDSNQTYAFDGRWGIGRFGMVKGFAARTATPDVSGDQHAFQLGGRYDTQGWLLDFNYTEVADNFNPEVGFLSRRGYRKQDLLVFRRYRPENFLGLHEIRPHVAYRTYWDFEGFQETGWVHIDNHWEWRNGYEIHTGVNLTHEGVKEPFEIYKGVQVPAGVYEHAEVQIVANTNEADRISFSLRTFFGGRFGGNRNTLSPTMRLRISDSFNTAFSWDRNDFDLPWGDFVSNLGRARLSYSFTPRIFAQTLLQYNDRSGIWSMNLRFGWQQSANTGFFVVYNDTRDLELRDRTVPVPGRSLVIKFSRLFDLLD